MRFNSVVTALAVMYAAEKYLVSRITRLALRFINKNATSENVLMILQHLYVLHQRNREDEEGHFAPSAPPLEVLEQDLGGFVGNNNNRPDLDKERHHESHTKLTSHSFEKDESNRFYFLKTTQRFACKGLIGDAIVLISLARQ